MSFNIIFPSACVSATGLPLSISTSCPPSASFINLEISSSPRTALSSIGEPVSKFFNCSPSSAATLSFNSTSPSAWFSAKRLPFSVSASCLPSASFESLELAWSPKSALSSEEEPGDSCCFNCSTTSATTFSFKPIPSSACFSVIGLSLFNSASFPPFEASFRCCSTVTSFNSSSSDTCFPTLAVSSNTEPTSSAIELSGTSLSFVFPDNSNVLS